MARVFLLVSLLASSCSAMAPPSLKPSAPFSRPTAPTRPGGSTRERERIRPPTRDPWEQPPPGFADNPSQFEWLIDEEARENQDEFHILLLGATFEKPRMDANYVVAALNLVLAMPRPDAKEHATLAEENGMSVLGTWDRDSCLKYCDQLAREDMVVRVIPGGFRGRESWQSDAANVPPSGLEPPAPAAAA